MRLGSVRVTDRVCLWGASGYGEIASCILHHFTTADDGSHVFPTFNHPNYGSTMQIDRMRHAAVIPPVPNQFPWRFEKNCHVGLEATTLSGEI